MLELGLLLLIIFAAWVASAWVRSRRTSGVIRTAGSIRGPKEYACEIVGESHYQDHLEQLAGGRSRESAEVNRKAVLYLDNDNPHDRKAVAIYIDGLLVGYLPRDFARGYRAQLKRKKTPHANLTCDARIVGGWDRGGDNRGHFGVRLDLPIKDLEEGGFYG